MRLAEGVTSVTCTGGPLLSARLFASHYTLLGPVLSLYLERTVIRALASGHILATATTKDTQRQSSGPSAPQPSYTASPHRQVLSTALPARWGEWACSKSVQTRRHSSTVRRQRPFSKTGLKLFR